MLESASTQPLPRGGLRGEFTGKIKTAPSRSPDPAIPPLYSQRKGSLCVQEIAVLLCFAALFTIDKIWYQPKWPSTDKLIFFLMQYIYTIDYYSALKKK